MKITLYKEDNTDSGWFDVLRAAGKLPLELKYDDIFNEQGVVVSDYAHLFQHNQAVELTVEGTAQATTFPKRVVFEFDTNEQAHELFEHFRHAYSAEYKAQRQYIAEHLPFHLKDYVADFYYDSETLTITGYNPAIN